MSAPASVPSAPSPSSTPTGPGTPAVPLATSLRQRLSTSSGRVLGVLAALAAVFVVFTVLEPAFISVDNVSEIVVQSSIIGVVALGMTLVIVTGGIDLSVGSIVGVVSVVCATNLGSWTPFGTIVAGLVLGGLLGLLNGVFTAYLGLASFIVTLATLNLYRGVAFLYTNGTPIFGLDLQFRNIFAGSILGVQNPILILLVTTVVCFLLLTRTRLGTYLRAIGSNPTAARQSGVLVQRTTVLAFVLSGVLCALAALLLMGRVGAAEPITGTGFELTAIAAVVVGGTSLAGGRASIVGTILGALLLGSIRTGLTLLNVNPYIQYVVTGAIILVAVLIDRFVSRRHTR
ncbi:ABC transporter permease [Lapillicoccus jejuensis]|uniref:Monosaccharide ABC transporter membrane protein (CUT2 family) n=1 Tax=Lapillicoccus jejuensis TaxID=402171 RepID=A0A542E173_9MICO|nr:monosaccharide ABC transporter membrane protein (CUT2 family) [Lapillicoccus jejuensis]